MAGDDSCDSISDSALERTLIKVLFWSFDGCSVSERKSQCGGCK